MIEEKIAYHADKGEIVPTRDMLKTIPQIEGIQKSADLNTAVLDHVAAHIHAGMSTAEIDKLVYDYTTEHGGIPAPLNYQGFPKSVCTSINNEICHGIPDENIILEEGDIINVDVSTILDGYFSDASRMFMIGKVSERAEKLVRVTQECVELGLAQAKPWNHLGDIADAINSHAKANNQYFGKAFEIKSLFLYLPLAITVVVLIIWYLFMGIDKVYPTVRKELDERRKNAKQN